VAIALAAVGCGGNDGGGAGRSGGGDKAAVVETTKRFQTAVLEDDGETYCDVLTGAAKRKLVAELAPLGQGFDCPKVAEKAFSLAGEDELQLVERSRRDLKERHVRVRGSRAVVTLPTSKRVLRLRKAGGSWLVSDPFSARKHLALPGGEGRR
jgi:hypothetical protein